MPEANDTDLAGLFVTEAGEYVAQLNRDLLEVETGADEARRRELFDAMRRNAHTLKGSAGFTPYREIVDRAHEVESLLGALESGADRATFNALYGHLDAILAVFESPAARVESLESAPSAGAEESVRVPTRKLNALMSLIGEILVARVRGDERLGEFRELRRRFDELVEGSARERNGKKGLQNGRSDAQTRELQRAMAGMQRELERDSMHMAILTENLQEEIKRVRMQPVGVLFDAFRRTVRDLAMRASRQVSLEITGESTEVDKKILEELREPLLHLLRNAIDHGIEPPAERATRGKVATGRISLRAATNGHTLTVEIEDDGRGLDFDAIRGAALRQRLFDEDRVSAASEDELAELLFRAGFTTRTSVGELSGRGVGLDAVRDTVRRLQGDVSVTSEPGRGTRFTLTAPLTLSTSRGLLLRAGNGTYALPFSSIERIVRVAEREIIDVDGHEAIRVDGRTIGLLRLADALGTRDAGEKPEKVPAVILQRGSERLAIAADSLLSEQEMVVKSLGSHLRRIRGIAGAAILGSGSIVTVLNPSDLFEIRGRRPRTAAREVAAARVAAPRRMAHRILVVEDSLTTRTLEKSILETAGYAVRTARNGVEALRLLEASVDDVVVTDVDMPEMNGIQLLREIRHRDVLRDIPVILLTSLGSDEDRRAGLDHGANAYIVKTEFDQNVFLHAVESVVGA